MLSKLHTIPIRTAAALGIAAFTVTGFALAWANASSSSSSTSPSPVAELASSEAPGDISGPCDEAENARKPECSGVAVVDDDDSATATSSTSTSTPTAVAHSRGGVPASEPSSSAPTSDVRTFAAADAGTVTYSVDGTTLTLIDAAPASGWRVEVEQAGGLEIDLDFRSGTRRVQVDVELEDGSVRERVRVRDDADDSRTEIVNGTPTEDETEDHGHDDSSGPGSGDDSGSDDDSSGTSSGDDSGSHDDS